MRLCLLALLLAWSCTPFLSAQSGSARLSSPQPTGGVHGHVLCTDTQQPARLAHVVLQPMVDLNSPLANSGEGENRREGVFRLQTTGLNGEFSVSDVPPGLYYVIAELEGYVSPLALFSRAELNHPTEALLPRIARYMTSISVAPGQVAEAEIRLIRGAVVAGNVRFEDGSPVVNSDVQLLQRTPKGEWTALRTGHLASHSSSYSDDQGNFRFSGIPAGEYLVRASIELNNVVLDHIFSSNGSTSYGDGYHLRVFPGDAFRERDAKPFKLEEGESTAGVAIDVPLSKLYSLSGTVLRPASSSPVNAAHLTVTYGDTGEELTSADVNANDGTFHFNFVPQGTYGLKATRVQQVQRTEVPNCDQCIPPSHTETKTLESFGDNSLSLQLTSDQTGIVLHAKPKQSQ